MYANDDDDEHQNNGCTTTAKDDKDDNGDDYNKTRYHLKEWPERRHYFARISLSPSSNLGWNDRFHDTLVDMQKPVGIP